MVHLVRAGRSLWPRFLHASQHALPVAHHGGVGHHVLGPRVRQARAVGHQVGHLEQPRVRDHRQPTNISNGRPGQFA